MADRPTSRYSNKIAKNKPHRVSRGTLWSDGAPKTIPSFQERGSPPDRLSASNSAAAYVGARRGFLTANLTAITLNAGARGRRKRTAKEPEKL
jgi:hypothetical protein